jgi:hypothetical protein
MGRPLIAAGLLAVGLLIYPGAPAQVPDLEALERQLEERKAEERKAEERKAEEAARRAQEAQRAAEARLRWNQFERVGDGVMDRQQNSVWAAADNGRDINWPDATAYCRSLGPGWSLPSVSQLQSLYARDTPFSQTVSGHTIYPATNLIRFTGYWYWSSEAQGSSEAWGVVLGLGSRHSTRQSTVNGRALCVRRP